MIPWVIIAAKNQLDRVSRLCKYVHDLDGTKLVVLPKKEPNEPYPHCTSSAFHQAAVAMKGHPFGWMECDCAVLKPGWAKALEEEYNCLGKPFMLSSDSNPPHDLVGGIGIYGPETHWLIPEKFEEGAWDGWIIKHIPELISKTPLIQHSYGKYLHGVAHPWLFPRDKEIIRKDAVLFHRDRFQGIIDPNRMPRFSMSNDVGDFIACLPVIRQMGGGHITIGNVHDREKRKWKDIRKSFDAIKPLLETAPYVHSVTYAEDHHNADYDLTEWRTCYRGSRTLTESQAQYLGVQEVDMSPWLDVKPDIRTRGKVVIARSPRYQNASFPWMEAVQRYRGKMVFIGHPEEHKAWEQLYRGNSEYIPTKDFLEIAGLISRCEFCICNQSSPGWVAMALGKKLIQESYYKALDSRVPRPDNQYVDGFQVKWPTI